jgi:hypothetical protein
MVQEPSKALPVTIILLVVAALLAPTILTVLSYIGPLSLAIIWLFVLLAAVAYYAHLQRSRADSTRKERDDFAEKLRKTESMRMVGLPPDEPVKDLLLQIAELQKDKSRLEKESSDWQRAASEQKEARVKAERGLVDLKRDISDEATPTPEQQADLLRPQLKQISRLRKFRAPLEGKERTEFTIWRTRTAALLWQALGVDSVEAENFEDIEFEPAGFLGLALSDQTQTYAKGLDEAEALLKTAIEVYLSPPAAGKERE